MKERIFDLYAILAMIILLVGLILLYNWHWLVADPQRQEVEIWVGQE